MSEQTINRPVTRAELRRYGVCHGKHKGLGHWKLLCGCMKHPPEVSVVRENGKWLWRINKPKPPQALPRADQHPTASNPLAEKILAIECPEDYRDFMVAEIVWHRALAVAAALVESLHDTAERDKK